jgi:predicted Zn-dependent protease
VLSRQECQNLVDKVLSFSHAEGCAINIGSSITGNVRFAANQLSTSGGVEDAQLVVQSSFGPKHAVVTTNDFSDASVRRVVEESERLAHLAPDDPEALPELPRQQYHPVDAWFESTANLAPADRAHAAQLALDEARHANDLTAAGFLITSANSTCVANKAGLFAYHKNTSSNYTLTVRTADGTGSGWAAADDQDFSRMDVRGVTQRAVDKARASKTPVAIEPGRYTVIMEPQAVGDLVQLMIFYMGAREADEGRSPFVKQEGGSKVGERIVDQRVNIYSDPADSQLLAQPFDGEGLPLGRQDWVKDGVLQQLYYTRFWAQKSNKPATGFPSSVKMAGSDQSVDQLIAGTERGVLVTRLWYLREVDPRTILYTGLTRDGTFLVENGRISKAVRNFRFNDSPIFMLNNLDNLGRPQRLAGTEAGGDIVMPSVKAREFNFTSLSEAV